MEGGKKRRAQDLLLALAALVFEMGGTLLCVASVLTKKNLLSEWVQTVYGIVGGIAGLLLLALYLCIRSLPEGRWGEKIKRCGADVLRAELWLAAIYCLWYALRDKLKILQTMHSSGRILYPVVLALITLAAVGAASFLASKLLRACGLSRGKGFGYGLRAFALTALAVALRAAAPFLWGGLTKVMGPSVPGMLSGHVFAAFCLYAAVQILMAGLCGRRKEDDGFSENVQVSETPGASLALRAALGLGLPVIVILATVFLAGYRFPAASVTKQVAAIVERTIGEGYAALEEGNLEKALQCFARAEARIRAFRSLVSEEGEETLEDVRADYPDDPVVEALWLSGQGDAEELETKIRNYTYGSEWYPILLRYYDEAAKPVEEQAGLSEESTLSGEEMLPKESALSADQRALRDKILLWFVAREQVTGEAGVFVRDLEGNKLAVLKQLQSYEEDFALCGLFRLMADYRAEGGYSEELVYEALQMSEEEPENIFLQYAAYRIGSSYQEDQAGHYARTMDAAARFDSLYDDGTRTAEQVAREKRELGDAAARCYQYETALEYYEASYKLAGEAQTALSCAKIQEKLENYEECAKMAEGVLLLEPDNGQALYLLALSSLKTGDVDGALSAAGRLGDLVADGEKAENVAEENYLYVCAQYLAMSDSSSWTDYTWQVYSYLTEEQIAELKSHRLTWDYMTAIHQCFMRKNYEEATQSVENILAVRDDLPMAWYLRGTISFNWKDYETALEDFGRAMECGSQAPALYFSIANVYDAMKDYENAWAYAKRVEEMLPYQDHGNDVYGISIHNKRLLNAMEDRLRR